MLSEGKCNVLQLNQDQKGLMNGVLAQRDIDIIHLIWDSDIIDRI